MRANFCFICKAISASSLVIRTWFHVGRRWDNPARSVCRTSARCVWCTPWDTWATRTPSNRDDVRPRDAPAGWRIERRRWPGSPTRNAHPTTGWWSDPGHVAETACVRRTWFDQRRESDGIRREERDTMYERIKYLVTFPVTWPQYRPVSSSGSSALSENWKYAPSHRASFRKPTCNLLTFTSITYNESERI